MADDNDGNSAPILSVRTSGSIFAAIGPNTPEWRKIIRINNDGTSEVVQDYTLVKQVEQALLDLADDDDSPSEQQLLMSAWQAVAMYLSTCDDEDKAAALNALKVISNLMSNNSDGPTPSGTFGATMQMASANTFTCPTCKRTFSTQQGLINHLKTIHKVSKKDIAPDPDGEAE